MQSEDIIHLINKIPEFRDIPDTSKQWLAENSTVHHYQVDDVIFEPGTTVDSMKALVEGKFQIRMKQGDGWRELGTFSQGSVTGLLPYSRMQSSLATGFAIEPSIVLELHKDWFPELKREHEELTQNLVHALLTRVRDFTSSQQQNEKLVALGKLSAGLAHELNNPAAAIVRSSRLLKDHLGTVPERFKSVMEIEADHRQVDEVNDLLFSKLKNPPKKLSLIERTELEDDMMDFLDGIDYENAMDDAALFVDFDFSVEEMEQLQQTSMAKDFPAIVGWMAQVITTEKMVDEIEKASSRISDLIKSIKSYTHMDRSNEKEAINPIQGIEDTLQILNHKIRKKGVALDLEAKEDLPKIMALPSELNQVWMNVLDNALDALPEKGGILKIRSFKEGDFLLTEIEDNGSGIPDEILRQIFDPFFTTKKVGEGTGLGLDVSKKIIDNHNGAIRVKSEPGQTIFTICIPYEKE